MIRKAINILLALILSLSLSAIDRQRMDSLLLHLSLSETDFEKAEILVGLSNLYNSSISYHDKSFATLGQALAIVEENRLHNVLIDIYISYGNLYFIRAEYFNSITSFKKALTIADSLGSDNVLPRVYNSLGDVYHRLDNHPRAAGYYLQAIKYLNINENSIELALSMARLGNVFLSNGLTNEAFEYLNRALKLCQTIEDSTIQSDIYYDLGVVFERMNDYELAHEYFKRSLELCKEFNHDAGIAQSIKGLGRIALINGDNNTAYNYFHRALSIDKLQGRKSETADGYINMGCALLRMGRITQSAQCAYSAIELAQEIMSLKHRAYHLLSQVHHAQGEYESALGYYNQASLYKDSVLNENTTKAISMLRLIYETERNENEIEILTQANKLSQRESERQRSLRNLYFIGFFLALLISASILFALITKRKTNLELSRKNADIESTNTRLVEQSKEIMVKNIEIDRQRKSIVQKNKHLEEAYKLIEDYIGKLTDSIRYAERIQSALISPIAVLEPYFSDTFKFYRPKDFVSGDFYWISTRDERVYFALADCTGHGVPGAFMSIIGMDLLNQALAQRNMSKPAELLNFIGIEIRKRLRMEEDEAILKDTMDIALCCYNPSTRVIEFSGALVPLTIIRNRRLIVEKPDVISLGTISAEYSGKFQNREIQLEPGDWIYLFSDGYMDQFGGERSKKFMKNRFLETLVHISTTVGASQAKELERVFDDWKGNQEQVDDVLVLGIRV